MVVQKHAQNQIGIQRSWVSAMRPFALDCLRPFAVASRPSLEPLLAKGKLPLAALIASAELKDQTNARILRHNEDIVYRIYGMLNSDIHYI